LKPWDEWEININVPAGLFIKRLKGFSFKEDGIRELIYYDSK
jgi:hypothetical protein